MEEMEPINKKNVKKFDTFYPTQEELDWLANNGYEDLLDKRVGDKTPENMMKDVLVRRQHRMEIEDLNKLAKDPLTMDVAMIVALTMDIRDVLNATNMSIFALIVANDEFWKKRFERDFPEILFYHQNTKIYPRDVEEKTYQFEELISAPGTNKFKNQPWRRYYNVVRYYYLRFVRDVIEALNKFQDTSNNHKNIYSVYRYDKASFKFSKQIRERKTENRLGSPKYMTFQQILIENNLDPIEYVFTKPAPIKGMNYNNADYATLFSSWTRELKREVQQGYKKLGGPKHQVVIGACMSCNDKAASLQEKTTGLVFCNRDCQINFYSSK